MCDLKILMIKCTGASFNKHIMITNLEAGIESSYNFFDIEKLKYYFLFTRAQKYQGRKIS